MRGMLLGLGDVIASAIGGVFQWIMETVLAPVLTLVVRFVLEPIINIVVNILIAIFGLYFYQIGVLLMALIDFVNMLFRALAGLGPESADRMYAVLSLDGGEGDILVQLIRHPDIQSAFLSMCVVGLFLLVITTVFQIIKVEYTTEGAKNAKGPIFQKAFKGLANLMLLPLLCVFGIILANQVLTLLDTATKADGDNPTISGQLFVTAAANAHWRKDDYIRLRMKTGVPNYDVLLLLPDLILSAFDAGFNAVTDVKYDENGYQLEFDVISVTEGEAGRRTFSSVDEIDTNFVNQADGFKYYSAGQVSTYYNYVRINYIVLILGGFTVLKCLFFSCFGMVIRLYKCAILFIIAPAVIGMTPMNEGGLGKWRGQFIGQVLSAYGTILAINLFFIVLRVLLSLDISFVNVGGFTFNSMFMTALVKSIIVIAGCLLIEGFAKDLGGFFGAEDAMGAGKGMAKQVGDTAMKGVKVAAGVASTVAAFTPAGAAVKAVGGIAGKIGSGVAGIAKGAVGGAASGFKDSQDAGKGFISNVASAVGGGAKGVVKGVKTGVSGVAKAVRQGQRSVFDQTNLGTASAALFGTSMDRMGVKDAKKEKSKFYKELASGGDESLVATISDIDKIDSQLNNPKSKLTDDKRQELENKRAKLVGDLGESKKPVLERLNSLNANLTSANVNVQDGKVSAQGELKSDIKELKTKGIITAMNTFSTFTGLAEEGKSLISPDQMLFGGKFGSAKEKGAKSLPEPFQQILDNKSNAEKKARGDHADGLFGKFYDKLNVPALAEIGKEAASMLDHTGKDLAKKINSVLKNVIKDISDEDLSKDERSRYIGDAHRDLRNMGANISRSELEDLIVSGKTQFGLKDVNIEIDHAAIGQEIKSILENAPSIKKAVDMLETMAKSYQNKDGGEKIVKAIYDVMENIGKKIGSK
ncbi:MAG: hypothetical protein IJW59_00925 [Clostridia bacterium]|nr:hypothetical protein [Clostridia bacterium]